MLNANWIHCKDDMGDCVPLYKKCFRITKPLRSAFMYISARGVYEATLNGERIGDFILAPGWTSYEHRIQYQKYDISNLLTENNTLTVAVAAGWYKGNIAEWWSHATEHQCALIAKIEITFTDGSVETIYTDTSWTAALSGYKFCEIYDGFIFDARTTLDFCLKTMVAQNNSKAELIAQIGEKIIEQERFKPAEIIQTPKGETVIDFGQNLTGYVEISLTAKAGDRVSLSFAKVLDSDGNFYNENYRTAKCQYTYICRDGKQTFKPTLTFYGYRYIRLDQYPVEVKADNFTSIAVYSQLKRTGYIESSDGLLNQFFDNVLWGQRSNFLDVPTDCPQRNERMGWTGDAQVFIRAASYNYDVNNFLKNGLAIWRLISLKTVSFPWWFRSKKAIVE